jgi:hypothetical protein
LSQPGTAKLASKINCDKTRIYLFPVPKRKRYEKKSNDKCNPNIEKMRFFGRIIMNAISFTNLIDFHFGLFGKNC